MCRPQRRIRHFGFLANRCKKDNIHRIRELKGVSETVTEKTKKNTEKLMLELTGTDITMCPCCKKGTNNGSHCRNNSSVETSVLSSSNRRILLEVSRLSENSKNIDFVILSEAKNLIITLG